MVLRVKLENYGFIINNICIIDLFTFPYSIDALVHK